MSLKKAFGRYRTEIVVFSIGALLFAGGLFNVISSNRNTNEDVVVETRPSAPRPSALGEVGPSPGVDLATYIDTKRKLLQERAKASPKEASFAVVSFDRYQTPAETEGFIKVRGIEVHSIEVRVPLPGYPSEALSLESTSVTDGVGGWRQRTLQTLKEELAALKEIIPTVDDKEFKKVYQEDAESRTNAISILEGDGSVVFGVLLRGSHADLLKVSQMPGVLLVDLPQEPAITPETHRFKALPPQ